MWPPTHLHFLLGPLERRHLGLQLLHLLRQAVLRLLPAVRQLGERGLGPRSDVGLALQALLEGLGFHGQRASNTLGGPVLGGGPLGQAGVMAGSSSGEGRPVQDRQAVAVVRR